MGHLLRSVASIALPIIGNAIAPGIGGALGGALGGVVNGGGVGNIALGALGGGLSGGFSPFSGSLADTAVGQLASPLEGTLVGQGITGLDNGLSSLFNSATSGLNGIFGSTPSSAVSSGLDSGANAGVDDILSGGVSPSTIQEASSPLSGVVSGASQAAPKTLLSGLTNTLSNDPLGSLLIGANLYSKYQQDQKQKNILSDQAAQNQAYNNAIIQQLHAPVTQRQQLPVDLTNYGHTGGEGVFFNMNPMTGMKAGGAVGNLTHPQQTAQLPDSPLSGAVAGPGGGQDDQVPIMGSDGERMIPADVVAAAGDGSNKAGQDKFQELEQNLRKHKGMKKTKTIPPKAKKLSSYMGK